jgi:hypothetical protein
LNDHDYGTERSLVSIVPHDQELQIQSMTTYGKIWDEDDVERGRELQSQKREQVGEEEEEQERLEGALPRWCRQKAAGSMEPFGDDALRAGVPLAQIKSWRQRIRFPMHCTPPSPRTPSGAVDPVC